MSLLEELLGGSLDEMSDEELEQAIIEGRLGREYTEVPATKERKKKAAPKADMLDINLDDLE